MPLTTQYNIPTENAIVHPIIKKSSFNRKMQSQTQLQAAVHGENFSQKLQLVHSAFPGSICWKVLSTWFDDIIFICCCLFL